LASLPEERKAAPSLGAKLFRALTLRENMTTILQVEFRESLLSIRDEILQSLGHPVVSFRFFARVGGDAACAI
jgi:hypothetical protein